MLRPCNHFLHINLKKGEQSEEDFELRVFSLNDFYLYWKVLLCCWLEVYFFHFLMLIFTTSFRRGSKLCKSTLKMKTLFRRYLTLFKSTLTLFNVVNSNVDVHNAFSMFVWRCMTSRRHINIRATLKQRWNVRWVT